MGPAQDSPFTLLLWYTSKTIPNFQELSLYLSKISSNYFDDDIYLVHGPLGGIKYCNMHIWYTLGTNILIISFFVSDNRFPVKSYFSVIPNIIFITFLQQNVPLSHTGCCQKNIVANKVGQGGMFIPIPPFQITHINTTMYAYTVFTFSIVVYIPTIIFTWKPHSTLLKKRYVKFFYLYIYNSL